MQPEEYIQQFILENPLIFSDPNYLTLLKTNIHMKYYYDPAVQAIQDRLEEILRSIGKMRSEETVCYPSTVKEGHLDYLRNIYQPEQRTPPWYTFRHDHITASNAWKALGTVASQNQLIYEKCLPIQIDKYKPSLTETPMSWGNKYEHLTTCLYEERNQTTISSFGCIEHRDYPFLAASPDGIVTGEINYGRMIEIKNVVSREINGNPKEDYYIQMQLQMEVCDLEECDFVETKNEYSQYEGKKGVIMVFLQQEEFSYRYMPFDTQDYSLWIDETFSNTPLTWFKNVYWKLDVYSCVLVKRQREWFKAAVPAFVSIWDTILRERESGEYVNRAPKKRIKNELKTESLVIM
jgi:putative phage-type endonuclease